MTRTDTIVAAATPLGRGGIGIVRVSGPKVPELAAVILGELPQPRRATFSRFLDAHKESIDAGLALFFPAPHSYTGEHVLELHGHGGPLVVEAVVTRVVELGARRALPGEFTQRAFLNDKVDLAQAEAIADLIDAGSRQAVLGDGARTHRSRDRAAHLRGGGDRLSGRGTRLSGRPRARRAVSSRARPFRWRRAKRAPGPTPA